MDRGRKKIRVIYSSTNEKKLKDVISALISVHEQKFDEDEERKAGNQ